MKIIFLGAPGSGKGTQAKKLSLHYKINTLSTGDLLRKEISNNSEIGCKAKDYINNGLLVPDDIINDIVNINVTNNTDFILDGYPRTLDQAISLDNILNKNNTTITNVFYFEASSDVLIKRICGRYSCKKCKTIYNKYFKNTKISNICDYCDSTEFEVRNDDNEEVLKQRLEVFNNENKKILDYYQKNNLIYMINALKNEGFIFENLVNYLG
ncbi:nucleoside monophosphate kinase [Rickettsiales bacterium]|jgi:adenylate kinase|nr:nucleoside monophosphate kinase [Rickettsiales bacterium]